jgi:hypothetical protein
VWFVHVIYSCTRNHSICHCLPPSVSLHVCMSSVSCFLQRTLQKTSRDVSHFAPLLLWPCYCGVRTEVEFVCLLIRIVIPDPSFCTFVNQLWPFEERHRHQTLTVCCSHPCVKVSGPSRTDGRIFGFKTRTVVGVPIYSCLLLTALLFTIYGPTFLNNTWVCSVYRVWR